MKMKLSSRWFTTNKKPAIVEASAHVAHYATSGEVSILIFRPSDRPRGLQAKLYVTMAPADAVKLANQLLYSAQLALNDQVLSTAGGAK